MALSCRQRGAKSKPHCYLNKSYPGQEVSMDCGLNLGILSLTENHAAQFIWWHKVVKEPLKVNISNVMP